MCVCAAARGSRCCSVRARRQLRCGGWRGSWRRLTLGGVQDDQAAACAAACQCPVHAGAGASLDEPAGASSAGGGGGGSSYGQSRRGLDAIATANCATDAFAAAVVHAVVAAAAAAAPLLNGAKRPKLLVSSADVRAVRSVGAAATAATTVAGCRVRALGVHRLAHGAPPLGAGRADAAAHELARRSGRAEPEGHDAPACGRAGRESYRRRRRWWFTYCSSGSGRRRPAPASHYAHSNCCTLGTCCCCCCCGWSARCAAGAPAPRTAPVHGQAKCTTVTAPAWCPRALPHYPTTPSVAASARAAPLSPPRPQRS